MPTTMASLTPGQRYLLRQLPALAAPPVVVYLGARLARDYFHRSPPTPLLLLAYALSWPIAFFLHVQWIDFSNRLRARRWGTLMPPTVQCEYPGGVDLIRSIFTADKSQYLGAYSLYAWCPQLEADARRVQATGCSSGRSSTGTRTTSGSCSRTGCVRISIPPIC